MAGKNAQLVWYPEPRYDTVIFPAGALSSAIYFSLPIGQVIAGGAAAKTMADTNLRNSSTIGNPNQFELHGFAVEPEPIGTGLVATTQADWNKIYTTGVFSFLMGGSKNLLQVPLTRIPMATGLNTLGTTTAGAASVGWGAPFSSNYYAFHKINPESGEKVQLLLDGDTTFTCSITYPKGAITLTTAIRVRVFMIGFYGSAVQ